MKITLRRALFVVIVLVLIYTATSCSLPFKIVPNIQTTNPPPVATTPPVPSLTSQPVVSQETPTIGNVVDLNSLVPVSGSVLTWIDLSDFVYVPAGEFSMGQDSTTPSDHAPAHNVNIAGFWIQQAEVTNQQYAQCVTAGACTAPAKENDTPYWFSQPAKVNNPVVSVTWIQANQYCEYIQSRLPTEAEWEKTARGTQNFIYPWGNKNPTCSLLNYDNCLDPSEPTDVRSYSEGASEFKALDMTGNVSEWVNDWYAKDYYTSSPVTNPVGPVDGTKKVYRGGSFSSNLDDVNPAVRFSLDPNKHTADIGFRCVLKGDYVTNNNQVPRPCEVLPVNASQPEEQPTWTPQPCQPAVVTSGCHTTAGGQMRTWIDIYQSNCQYNLLSGFDSNAVPDIYCAGPTLDANTAPKEYTCVGTNMIQGANVDVFFWHDYLVSQIEKICPVGYVLDSANSFCVPGGAWLPDPPCPYGYTELEGVCLPLHSSQNGCPVGFYELMREITPNVWNTYCAPLDECLLQGAGANCTPPVCAPGQTYDPANQCCAVPAKLHQVCPVGLSLKIDPMTQKNYCEPIGHLLDYENRTVKIAYCPTPTPTAVIPCTTYTNGTDCSVHGCDWKNIGGAAPNYVCR